MGFKVEGSRGSKLFLWKSDLWILKHHMLKKCFHHPMMQFRLGNVFLQPSWLVHSWFKGLSRPCFDIKVFPCVGSFPFTGWGVCQEQAVMRFWTKVWKKHRRPASTVHLENSFTICIPKRNQKYSQVFTVLTHWVLMHLWTIRSRAC